MTCVYKYILCFFTKQKRSMSRVEKLMVAIPSKKDNNLFAFHLRKKFTPNGVGICAQLAQKTGLNKKLVSKAFGGKAVTSSVASKIARAIGFEGSELFAVLPPEVPKNERCKPSKLRQYVTQA